MVSALHILTAGLAAAFLLGLLKDGQRSLAYAITLVTLSAMSAISAGWVWTFAGSATPAVDIFTAGTLPPFAINLRMGPAEAGLTLLINLIGLFSALALKDTLRALGGRAMAVWLVAVMALSGIVLTRDLFNLFVFFELTVIAGAGLLLLAEHRQNDGCALAAGFKYLIVSQFVSAFLLIGIIFAYHATGTLNLDDMAAAASLLGGDAAQTFALAFFLIFIAVVVELKPFPANGWALDIYEPPPARRRCSRSTSCCRLAAATSPPASALSPSSQPTCWRCRKRMTGACWVIPRLRKPA
jgi:formate hydrogenlyase subunit 3/multisubunit Na+/H+ antiporter MnhD subunit